MLRSKLIGSLVISFLVLCSLLSFTAEAHIDLLVRDSFVKEDRGPLSSLMGPISYLGDVRVTLTILPVLSSEVREDALKSLLLSSLAVALLKVTIGKRRPPGPIEYQFLTLEREHHSFASGHAARAFALASTISYHYPAYKWVALPLATLVGLSRLFEDEHWVTDVLVGSLLGSISALLVYRVSTPASIH